ncbi:hypothetical protein [Xanthomonas euvesicatoria]|uniref:hypothetical protein n=1 Tax=Xanthomonas euvesicatoria TaxID=456327 RepID=UPI0031B956D6|nr:hypothetical protein [Stenotrophomonas maltophilia]
MTHSPRPADEERLATIAPAIVIVLAIGAGSLLGIGFGPRLLAAIAVYVAMGGLTALTGTWMIIRRPSDSAQPPVE